jgi:hypothetical protein
MSEQEIQKLLEKAGVAKDQFKYFTSKTKDLPGLFGFTPFQSERFGNLFGGLGEFDPSLIKKAYGEVASYGQERAADIGSILKTGIRGVQSGLGSGLMDIRETMGRGFDKFGARQREIGEAREEAGEAGAELGRRYDASMSLLGERLGQKRAAVGQQVTNWRDRLFSLVQSIYGLDPRALPEGSPPTTGFLQSDADKSLGQLKMPEGIEKRYAEDQLRQYFSQNNIEYSGDDWEKYIAEFAKAYKDSGNTLSVVDWWASR